jgi:carboxymethylenebutenolidase
MIPPANPKVGNELPVTPYEVEFTGFDGSAVPGRLWRPVGEGTYPGIVFVSDAFGLGPEMNRLGGMIASWGYAVLAPDLFAGGLWFACIRRLITDLKRGSGDSVETLLGARAYLAEQPFVRADSIGILGFCMGGGFALLLAQNEVFAVSAAFYGEAPKTIERSCPVVASFGGRDKVMLPSAAKLESALDRLGVDHDIKIYPDAGHAFMHQPPNAFVGMLTKLPPLHSGYNEAAAQDAAVRVYRFLRKHLGATPV